MICLDTKNELSLTDASIFLKVEINNGRLRKAHESSCQKLGGDSKLRCPNSGSHVQGGPTSLCGIMCHLAIEKMLKAILAQKYPEDVPPKIHNLIHLAQKTEMTLPDNLKDFFQRIDNVSVATRYPEDLRTLSKEFDKETAKRILNETKRMIKWLKQQLKSDK